MAKARDSKARDGKPTQPALGDRPHAVDGSKGELVVRRLVVWRRLEPGDARTPGTEIAPEHEHIEARVVEVGIAPSLRNDLVRLGRVRDEALEQKSSWTARYEPAGVLFSVGGGIAVGTWLDYLPDVLQPVAASLAVIGACVGLFTRRRRDRVDKATQQRWQKTDEHREASQIEKSLRPRWERFATRLLEETGFRVELRVGDVHEAERLISLDPDALCDPATWLPDQAEDEVRYGWGFADGRVVQQVAILEDNEEDGDEPDAGTGPSAEEE
ncbi:MAG: hypothetical protein AB8I08_37115 [Sandaracinaceae bacterium]